MEKIVRTIRRSVQVPFKIQHRISLRAQQELHQLGLNGLVYVGALVDLFEWVYTYLS